MAWRNINYKLIQKEKLRALAGYLLYVVDGLSLSFCKYV